MLRCGLFIPCLLALATTAAPAAARPMSAQLGPLPVGAGLEPITYWSRSNIFVDLVKQGGAFTKPGSGTLASTDANGWPTEDFTIMLVVNHRGMAGLGGRHRLLAQCNAEPIITCPASSATVSNVQWNATTGTVSADIDVSPSGTQLMLSMQGTAGGARNIRVLRPAYTEAHTFTQPFLDHLAKFKTIRFMDWVRANENTTQEWHERPLTTHARYSTTAGVPWEVQIDLANAVQRDMWITVPHRASDDYVRQLARLFRDRLDPALHLYVEYSNELWNYGFPQSPWNRERAIQEVAQGGSPLNYDGSVDPGQWAARRVGTRLRAMAMIFEEEFGPGSLNTRVRFVLAGQGSNPWVVRQGVTVVNDVFGPPSRWFYGIASAPYFDLGAANGQTNLTPTDVINALTESVAEIGNRYHFEEHAAIGRFHKLKVMTYEAGPDTIGPNNIESKRLASLDPRMRGITRDYLNAWAAYGLDMPVWFLAGATTWDTPFGTFGVAESMNNLNTPKLQAIDDVLAQPRPDLTGGRLADSEVDARLRIPRPPNWQAEPYLRWLSAGNKFDYVIRPPAPGNYALHLSTAGLLPNALIRVELNGEHVATVSVPQTTGPEDFRDGPPIALHLNTGLSVVRLLVVTSQAYNINALRFFPEPCAGDTDGDRRIDFVDLNAMLDQFGDADLGLSGDLDGDGDVDFADLAQVLGNFGATC